MYDLNEVYENLLKKKITCEDASKIIKSPEIQRSINYLININSRNKLIPYSEEDMQFIYMVINITQFIYNNSGEDTGITDYTYDILYAIMLQNTGKDVVTVPILSNNKVSSDESEFMNRYTDYFSLAVILFILFYLIS